MDEKLIGKFIVDRIEGDFAVCEEDGTLNMLDIPLSDLPKEVKEGSHIVIIEASSYIDRNSEEASGLRIDEKINKLFGD